ncbi:MAG: hypothetical protein LBG47_10615 [Prevotellaceae bacterium]|jgi:hypothetical protein|nr:hypothetical protein [Prevotellaceae bacterium]
MKTYLITSPDFNSGPRPSLLTSVIVTDNDGNILDIYGDHDDLLIYYHNIHGLAGAPYRNTGARISLSVKEYDVRALARQRVRYIDYHKRLKDWHDRYALMERQYCEAVHAIYLDVDRLSPPENAKWLIAFREWVDHNPKPQPKIAHDYYLYCTP